MYRAVAFYLPPRWRGIAIANAAGAVHFRKCPLTNIVMI